MNQSVYLFIIYLTMPAVTQTMQRRVVARFVSNEMERLWKKASCGLICVIGLILACRK
jgi:hypothetical protein